MGKLKNGPFSGFTGRTGSLVGYRKNGKWIMAAVKATGARPPSVLQLNQQLKFGKMVSFLSWMDSFIKIGFQNYDAEMSPMNAAVQYNLNNAITGTAPVFGIDYPKVLFSRGRLAEPYNTSLASTPTDPIIFNWEDNIGSILGSTTDQATFIAYNTLRNLFVVVVGGCTRGDLTYTLETPPDFAGEECECWMAFVSSDGKLVSNSTYMGMMTPN